MRGTMIVIQPSGEVTKRTYINREIPLADLNKAVGGYIEHVPLFDTYEGKDCIVFCNEYGKIQNLPYNKPATDLWRQVSMQEIPDHLVGSIAIITGDREFMDNL